FRQAHRQGQPDGSGQTCYNHDEPDVVSSQKFLLPFQRGCAAPVCSPSLTCCPALPEAHAASCSVWPASVPATAQINHPCPIVAAPELPCPLRATWCLSGCLPELSACARLPGLG